MADFALQGGDVGLGFATDFNARRSDWAASGTGKSLIAIALSGGAPAVKLTALDLQLAG